MQDRGTSRSPQGTNTVPNGTAGATDQATAINGAAHSTSSNGSNRASASSTSNNGRSRKNVAEAACLGCRKRRTRCMPGTNPGDPCEYCQKTGAECVYSNPQRKRESVKELRERLSRYEELLGSQHHQLLQNAAESQQCGNFVAPAQPPPHTSPTRPASPPLEISLNSPASDSTGGQRADSKRKQRTSSTSSSNHVRFGEGLRFGQGQSTHDIDDGISILLSTTPASSQSNNSSMSSQSFKRPKHTPDLQNINPSHTSNSSLTSPTDPIDHTAFTQSQQISRISPVGHSPSHASLPVGTAPGGVSDKFDVTAQGEIVAYGQISHTGIAKAVPGEPPSRQSPAPQHFVTPPPLTSSTSPGVKEDAKALLLASARNIDYLPMGTDLRVVEHLIVLYFLFLYPIFPIISLKAFMESYCQSEQFPSPLLLNAMLAYASKLSAWKIVRTDQEDPHTAGRHFLEKAKSYLEDELERPKISTAQALCLMAQMETLSGRAARGGLYFAMCGRIVLDLGLHLDPSPLVAKGIITPEEAFVRARAFWGLWSADKEFSALVGRPCTIWDTVITCPVPGYWEADDFDWKASYEAHRIIPLSVSGTGFLHLSDSVAELGNIYLEATKKNFWNVPHSTSKWDALRQNMQALEKAQARLPPVSADTLNGHFPVLITSNILFQNVKVMFNRPFLAEVQAADPDAWDPRTQCLKSTKEIIRLLQCLKRSTKYGLTISSNCHQYGLVLAGCVLVFEMLATERENLTNPSMELRARCADLQEDLSQVFSLLRETAPYRPAAKIALHDLSQALERGRTRNKQHSKNLSISHPSAALPSGTYDDMTSAQFNGGFDTPSNPITSNAGSLLSFNYDLSGSDIFASQNWQPSFNLDSSYTESGKDDLASFPFRWQAFPPDDGDSQGHQSTLPFDSNNPLLMLSSLDDFMSSYET